MSAWLHHALTLQSVSKTHPAPLPDGLPEAGAGAVPVLHWGEGHVPDVSKEMEQKMVRSPAHATFTLQSSSGTHEPPGGDGAGTAGTIGLGVGDGASIGGLGGGAGAGVGAGIGDVAPGAWVGDGAAELPLPPPEAAPLPPKPVYPGVPGAVNWQLFTDESTQAGPVM